MLALKLTDPVTAGDLELGDVFTTAEHPNLVFMITDNQTYKPHEVPCVCIDGYDKGCHWLMTRSVIVQVQELAKV